MENVDAEIHGWPAAPYRTKADTDASYVRLLERLLDAAASGTVAVGVASHNLFDVALALILSEETGAPVDIEMLAGMADSTAAAVAERSGRLLLYVPATTRRDFRNALAYLARRLDENTTPGGIPPARPGHGPGQPGLGGAGRSLRPLGAGPPRQVATRALPDPGPVTQPAPAAASRRAGSRANRTPT